MSWKPIILIGPWKTNLFSFFSRIAPSHLDSVRCSTPLQEPRCLGGNRFSTDAPAAVAVVVTDDEYSRSHPSHWHPLGDGDGGGGRNACCKTKGGVHTCTPVKRVSIRLYVLHVYTFSPYLWDVGDNIYSTRTETQRAEGFIGMRMFPPTFSIIATLMISLMAYEHTHLQNTATTWVLL